MLHRFNAVFQYYVYSVASLFHRLSYTDVQWRRPILLLNRAR